MRKFIIYVEMSDDLSAYDLVCKLNGNEIKRKKGYSLGDCCSGLYEFERSIYDEFNVDTRFDKFEIKFDIYC